jgi:phosphoribosylaminoimidazole-succinocarboxamide synthase
VSRLKINGGKVKKTLIYSGSVKDVYKVEDGICEFDFTDKVSVFDKPIGNVIPGKGETLCDLACFWFDEVKNLNIGSHFIERTGPKTIRVKEVQIIRDYSKIIDGKTNHLIPLEFILRHYVAGSFHDRLLKGKIEPESLGVTEVPYGMELSEPYFETSTKLESHDRLLSNEEALGIAKMEQERMVEIEDICIRIDDVVEEQLESSNLIHVDGKKEFGYDREGQLMIVDVFGTPDEDRYWDKSRFLENGEHIELSKEAVRTHYRKTGYKEELEAARKAKTEEPPIPEMPNNLVEEVSEIYKSIAKEILK